jgi:hypothetical protein
MCFGYTKIWHLIMNKVNKIIEMQPWLMLQQNWYTQQLHATQCIQQTEITFTKYYSKLPDKRRNGKTELLGSMAVNMKIP